MNDDYDDRLSRLDKEKLKQLEQWKRELEEQQQQVKGQIGRSKAKELGHLQEKILEAATRGDRAEVVRLLGEAERLRDKI